MRPEIPVRAIETMVDRDSVALVVRTLSIVCTEKADHIATTWQDAALAREWRAAARMLDGLAERLPRVPGIRHL